ncbi:hypothetical protein [Labrys monachus]|uniref:Translation initiation factor IF-2 n=1 Tax=Labrys monachus TaxID=217067 RepID=A0ABU0FLJ0_9HYPH|nr:hypothetical protein [Labrys monachus]MDQ0395473.1 hypothetical protein [Labrys monachus]
MLKYTMPAAFLAFFVTLASASALPVASSGTMVQAQSPQIVQVQMPDRKLVRPGRPGVRPGARPGRPGIRPGRPGVRPGINPGRPGFRPRPGVRPGFGGPRRFRYAPGARLGAPPYGWHRYRTRPYDWRTRGCIVVGPIWFCP